MNWEWRNKTFLFAMASLKICLRSTNMGFLLHLPYSHFLSWYKNGKCYNRKNTGQYKNVYLFWHNQIQPILLGLPKTHFNDSLSLSTPWNRTQGQQWNQGDINMMVNATIQVCQFVFCVYQGRTTFIHSFRVFYYYCYKFCIEHVCAQLIHTVTI